MPVYSINLTNRRLNILGIHIPKTGGTALNHFFKLMGFTEHFGTENHSIRSTMRISANVTGDFGIVTDRRSEASVAHNLL